MAQVIETHLNVDPIIRPEAPPEYIIDKSGSSIQITQYSADSDANGGSIIFSNIIPNSGTYVNRKLLMTFQAEFVLTAQAPYTGPIFPGGNLAGVCALRFMPVQNNATAITLEMNGAAVTINGRQTLEPLSRFGFGKDFVDTDFSLVPAYHDVSEYADSYNTNLNPLASLFDNSAVQPRGAFIPTIVSDAGGVAVLRVKWSEFLCISPLIWGRANEHGLYGVETLLLTINVNNYGRFLSYDNVNGTPLASIDGSFIAKPVINVQTITPVIPPPKGPRLYPYVNPVATPSSTDVIAPGSSLLFTSDNIQLSGIPSRLLVYARRRDASLTPFTADTYAYISSLSLNFDNTANIFSTYREEQLYQFLMAEQNYKYPFNLVKNYLGSCFMIDFGKSIPSTLLQAVGQQGKFNFQVTVNLTNLYSDASVFSLFVIPMYDGIISVENGVTQIVQSIVRNVDVLNAELASTDRFSYPNPHPEALSLDGGDFLQRAKRFGRKLGRQATVAGKQALQLVQKGKDFYDKGKDFYEKHQETIDDIIAGLKFAGKTAAMVTPLLLGLGYDNNTIYNKMRNHYSEVELMGAGLVGGCCGNGLIGGQMVTDPNSLLTGGSIVPYKKAVNRAPAAKAVPRKRLALEARS